jgi:ketosteroid isomerase-like protein
MKLPCRALVLFVLSHLFVSCSGNVETPEQQLKQLVEAAELAVEARDLSAAMAFVDPDYKDLHAREWPQIRGLLAGYLLRHPSIHILSKVDRIELIGETGAEMVLLAGLAGSTKEAETPFSQWRGRLIRLDLSFRRNQDGDWRLLKADWRPAQREDFVE